MTESKAYTPRLPANVPWPEGEVTVENCASEPIHVPGLIQPHGALVAFDPASGAVLHASTNLGAWLPLGTLPARGRQIQELLGDEASAAILDSLQATTGGMVRHHIVDLPDDGVHLLAGPLQALVHRHRGVAFIELERPGATGKPHDWMQAFNDTLDALRGTSDMEDLVERMAQRVRRLTGFDRVMVYRFEQDWHGHVIADAHESGMESLHDLHYPASDIPAQARELYRTNLVRFIPDVDYAPVPVQPWFDGDRLQALDMSHSMLRSVSPIHIEYLKNMAVRATLTFSLLVEGRLWGLIACHHRTPMALSLRLRRACYALSVTAGYMVGWHEQRARAIAIAAGVESRNWILDSFNEMQARPDDIVEQSSSALLRIVGASGGAFWQGDTVVPFGQWPAGDRGGSVLRYVRHAFETGHEDTLATDQAALYPALQQDELRDVCGVLAVKLDEQGHSGIVWVRPAYRREVAWGGDPDKPVQVETDAQGRPKLSPRTSFARWVVLVKDRSRPWTDLERDAARSLLPLRQVLIVRETLAQLSLSDRRFRGLVTLQSDAYWRLDTERRLVMLSRPLPTWEGPVEGRTLEELLAPLCDPAMVAGLTEALSGAKPFRGLRLKGRTLAENASFALALSGEPILDREGRMAGWHGTISDVTHAVAMQEALWVKKEAAELASSAKTRFMSQVSHELRTPLNAILGFSQLLLQNAEIPDKERNWAIRIKEAGDTLLEQVAGMIDFSQIENLGLQVAPGRVDARQVVDRAVDRVRERAAAQGVSLVLEAAGNGPHWCHGDAIRLRQAVVNLATNAIKYNRTDGSVRFVLHSDAAAGQVHIEVHDTGVGLTGSQVAQLFQPFNRLGRESLQVPGAGIGLVVAKQVIEAMGGRITVESERGRGSCFAIHLPLAPPA
jgi:light-regulated signal transduction histidine kinase (bacteriophytochrome)